MTRLSTVVNRCKVIPMSKASASEGQTLRQTQIRMGDDLRKEIDEYRDRVKRDSGLEVAFSTAVRTLIRKGLEVA